MVDVRPRSKLGSPSLDCVKTWFRRRWHFSCGLFIWRKIFVHHAWSTSAKAKGFFVFSVLFLQKFLNLVKDKAQRRELFENTKGVSRGQCFDVLWHYFAEKLDALPKDFPQQCLTTASSVLWKSTKHPVVLEKPLPWKLMSRSSSFVVWLADVKSSQKSFQQMCQYTNVGPLRRWSQWNTVSIHIASTMKPVTSCLKWAERKRRRRTQYRLRCELWRHCHTDTDFLSHTVFESYTATSWTESWVAITKSWQALIFLKTDEPLAEISRPQAATQPFHIQWWAISRRSRANAASKVLSLWMLLWGRGSAVKITVSKKSPRCVFELYFFWAQCWELTAKGTLENTYEGVFKRDRCNAFLATLLRASKF